MRWLAPVILALGLLSPETARAQACCAGGGAYLPAKLKLHEDALLGFDVHANDDDGSLSPSGAFVPNPPGAGELDLQQDLLGAIRLFGRGQLGVDVPFVETRRTATGLAEMGGGLGDVSLAFRYDFIFPAESSHLPGLALTAGVTAPTGVSPERAKSPLLTDATGTGAWQGLLGGEVEQTWGPWVATVDVLLSGSAPISVSGVHETLGPALTGFVAGGYAFANEAALALVLSTSQSLNAVINGAEVPQSGRGLTTAAVAGALPVTDTWRLQGSFNVDLPVAGRNRPTGAGATVTVVKAWL